MKILILLFVFISGNSFANSSMRRCTLLPITDSVGGAIGFKVFEEVEATLKASNWCTYVSNSDMITIFSRYRENLPQYLKQKEVLKTVSEKLKVGSIVKVTLVNEIRGVEATLEVFGDNGEDLYFSEKALLNGDEVELISNQVTNWLELYSKTIPYDAKINGILGDQLTLDVGKGYPIQVGQTFMVKRPVNKKKHPLLNKIVDWETELLAEGKVFNISDNQALGMVKVYKNDQKLLAGDWVRLEPLKADTIPDKAFEDNAKEDPGTLGVLSLALYGSSSSVDTSTPSGSNRMSGNLLGIDFRVEAWITRQYFAALEIAKSLGSMSKSSGSPDKDKINVNNGSFKLTGGYKYLPIGFFYGPQIDIYGGLGNHTFDLDYSAVDGFSKGTISGLLFGTGANIPINREYRFFAQAEFMPFPSFKDSDSIYGSAKSVSSLELEIGIKYQYTVRMTFDLSLETSSRKAKFGGGFKEISYKDNALKAGCSFNF